MQAPTVRLAATGGLMRDTSGREAERYPFHRANMGPTLRLAHVPGAQGDNCLMGRNGEPKLPATSAPALLISFFYLKDWLKNRDRYVIRDWVLDSGAFSALHQKLEINLTDYIETCKRLIDEEEQLTEIYALDVIGDWKKSLANTEKMWKAGVPAIPCYHVGEPWEHLINIARDYPKIAIGGMSQLRGNAVITYVGQCFARVWPKPVHGFAVGGRDLIMRFPWHSVDATNWELGPVGFGQWNSFGRMSVRGTKQNLRAEVEFYLALERRARARWEKQMTKLTEPPTLREQANKLKQ
jgi:hypothetical protein